MHDELRPLAFLLSVSLASVLAAAPVTADDDVNPKRLKRYQKAVEKAPDSPDAWYNLAAVQVALENWPEALEASKKAAELAPENPRAHFRVGESLIGLGRESEAVEHFETAVELDPAFLEGQQMLADAYLEAGRFDDAIDAYKQALRQRPENPSGLYTNLGDAYFKKGDVDQATRWFERTLEAAPSDPITHFNLGAIYARLSRDRPELRANACDSFGKAVELAPNDGEALFFAGEQCLLADREDESRGYLERFLKTRPEGQRRQFAEAYLEELDR